jgi:hypothetical protein
MSTHSSVKLESKGGAALHLICRQLPRILLLSALLTFSLSAATIQYQVSTSGTTGTYQYSVSGFVASQACPNDPTLTCNNEIDIAFDPTMFDQLSNGVAPAGFDLLLFQPNNPPQAPGDYSALAIVNNPSLAGPFSVDFIFNPGTPSGVPCTSAADFCQNFSIESFDSNGFFEGFAATGVTTPVAGPSPSPEPVSFLLSGVGLMIVGAVRKLALRGNAPIRGTQVNRGPAC